jgi:hypothetical protein
VIANLLNAGTYFHDFRSHYIDKTSCVLGEAFQYKGLPPRLARPTI